MPVSTVNLDYLQRVGYLARPPQGMATRLRVVDDEYSLLTGISRYEKNRRVDGRPSDPALPFHPPSQAIMAGLYGLGIPLAFSLAGSPGEVRFRVAPCTTRQDTDPERMGRRRDVLLSVFSSIYPGLDAAADRRAIPHWPHGAFVVGVPTVIPPSPEIPLGPYDRVITGMRGETWEVLVLAYPVSEAAIMTMRLAVLNEMREAEATQKAQGAPAPFIEQYLELMRKQLQLLSEAAAVGSWRTAVYLLGTDASYSRLVSVWRSVFAGKDSQPEPLRVFGFPSGSAAASALALPDDPGEPGPGHYVRPYAYQTVLPSSYLSAYVNLPEEETPGFSIKLNPRFDKVPQPQQAGQPVHLGQTLNQLKTTGASYAIPLPSLTSHVFVSGTTGAGKSTTIRHILRQVAASNVPFLVVEAAKSEYRSLLNSPGLRGTLRIFTAGDETVSPIRFNPFEFPDGTSVGVHLDLLKALFTATFGMWSPLPQILERALHEVYTDRGWDITTSTNRRLGPDDPREAAFPTISELVAKTELIIRNLGYSGEITSNMRAALVTRLSSLLIGGKGRMLDVQASTTDAVLFGGHSVLELERIGDDDDKALIIGLILIRLAELRRAERAPAHQLRHILVLEEAHRLLSRQGGTQVAEQGDPKQKAIETFVNLLAEVRAYGQGIIIADQVPTRLVPEVLKNTNLKITHRLVAADDRAAVAATMAMDDAQSLYLATLTNGVAAVFGEGDDAPLLVEIDRLAGENADSPDDAGVVAHMRELDAEADSRDASRRCCDGDSALCDTAKRLCAVPANRRTLARVILSLVEDPASLDRLWPDLLSIVAPERGSQDKDTEPLLACLCTHGARWFCMRRGQQMRWAYGQERELQDALTQVLHGKLADSAEPAGRERFGTLYKALSPRTLDPFPGCGVICAERPGLCLYRHAVADVIADEDLKGQWAKADLKDTAGAGQNGRPESLQVAMKAGYAAIEWPEPTWPDDRQRRAGAAGIRAAMCFAQQMICTDQGKLPRDARLHVAGITASRQDYSSPNPSATHNGGDS
jgi:DNA helicase HerA-like ATPase